MRFIDYIFVLFLLTNSFDPVGYYSKAKYVLFAVLVIYGLLSYIKTQAYISNPNRLSIISFVFIPIWGILIALLFNNMADEGFATSHFFALCFVFLFYYLITLTTKRLLILLWITGIIIAIVTLILFVLSELNPMFFEAIYNYGIETKSFLMAHERNFVGISVNGLYFKSGSLIIFSFIYTLYYFKGKIKPILSCILFLSLVFSGSRTPALVNSFILLIYFYDKIIGKRKNNILFLSAILIATIYAIFILAEDKGGAGSNELKFDNYESYINVIFQGVNAIFGTGVGSVFYAKGNGEYLAFTELTYFDIIRMYGIPLGTYLIILFFMPFFIMRKYFIFSLFLKRFYWGYVLFLILAGTNPTLLGSVGMLVVTSMMAISNRIEYDYKKNRLIDSIWTK